VNRQNSAPQKGAEFPFDEARHLMFGGSMLGQNQKKVAAKSDNVSRFFRDFLDPIPNG
jgi:hypothetical protein